DCSFSVSRGRRVGSVFDKANMRAGSVDRRTSGWSSRMRSEKYRPNRVLIASPMSTTAMIPLIWLCSTVSLLRSTHKAPLRWENQPCSGNCFERVQRRNDLKSFTHGGILISSWSTMGFTGCSPACVDGFTTGSILPEPPSETNAARPEHRASSAPSAHMVRDPHRPSLRTTLPNRDTLERLPGLHLTEPIRRGLCAGLPWLDARP